PRAEPESGVPRGVRAASGGVRALPRLPRDLSKNHGAHRPSGGSRDARRDEDATAEPAPGRARPGREGNMSAPGLKPAPPCAFVIFGAAGDLTKRKLLPALYNLKAAGLLPRQLAIVGVARKQKSHEEFREEQSKDIREFATQKMDESLWAE